MGMFMILLVKVLLVILWFWVKNSVGEEMVSCLFVLVLSFMLCLNLFEYRCMKVMWLWWFGFILVWILNIKFVIFLLFGFILFGLLLILAVMVVGFGILFVSLFSNLCILKLCKVELKKIGVRWFFRKFCILKGGYSLCVILVFFLILFSFFLERILVIMLELMLIILLGLLGECFLFGC